MASGFTVRSFSLPCSLPPSAASFQFLGSKGAAAILIAIRVWGSEPIFKSIIN